MLSKTKQLVKENSKEILFFISIFFLLLLSFALGFIYANSSRKVPLIIEEPPRGLDSQR